MWERIDEEAKRLISYLPAYIRSENRGGKIPQLHSENWQGCAREARATPVSQKRTQFLKFLKEKSYGLGDVVKVTWELDYPQVGAGSVEELSQLAKRLRELKYVEYPNVYREDITEFRLTSAGWESLESPAEQEGHLGQPKERKELSDSVPPARTASRKLKIFLCHSSGDKAEARNLYQQLRADGFEPWLDEENLLPGQEWQTEIAKAVRACDIFLACLSYGAVSKRGFVQKEIKHALNVADEQSEGTIFIIPLKLEECEIPDRLRQWQWVNFFEPEGYQKLKRALHIRADELQGVRPKIGENILPTTTPVPSSVTVTRRDSGDVEVILIWTYSQGEITADRFIIFQSSGTPLTIADHSQPVEVTSRTFRCFLPRGTTHRFGIAAARGPYIGPIIQPLVSPGWEIST
jgi:hypothetical protein